MIITFPLQIDQRDATQSWSSWGWSYVSAPSAIVDQPTYVYWRGSSDPTVVWSGTSDSGVTWRGESDATVSWAGRTA